MMGHVHLGDLKARTFGKGAAGEGGKGKGKGGGFHRGLSDPGFQVSLASPESAAVCVLNPEKGRHDPDFGLGVSCSQPP
jgi:hypothetical protein